MKKGTKTALIVIGSIILFSVLLAITAYVFIGLLWSGAFNKFDVHDIGSFDDPNGKYSLVYQQLGAPEWPFGPVEVRLTLKDNNGKKLRSLDTLVFDDGAGASELNIKSIEWTDASVVIVLRASEMPDKEITFYKDGNAWKADEGE